MNNKNMKRGIINISVLSAIICGIAFCITPAFASNTDGTIDASHKWVWASKIGWVNFGAANGNIHITDSVVSGYAWTENYGWIYLHPTTSGVDNDGEGNLSGQAWNPNLGWINFSGVVINSSGLFTGTASGDNAGTVNFDCTNCSVQTDWRPQSVRPDCNNTLDDDGDSLSDFPADPGCTSLTDESETNVAPPNIPGGGPGGSDEKPLSLVINNNDQQTNFLDVTLKYSCGSNGIYVWISEDPGLVTADKLNCGAFGTYTLHPFTLSSGQGLKTIYGKFCDQWGACSKIYSDDIEYVELAEEEEPPVEEGEEEEEEDVGDEEQSEQEEPVLPYEQVDEQTPSVLDLLKEVLSPVIENIIPVKIPLVKLFDQKYLSKLKAFVPKFFEEKTPAIEPTQFVSKKTPNAFKIKWELLPEKPINRFAFAPLPKELELLKEKFPTVHKLFADVGVNRFSDIEKLRQVKLTLPNLSNTISKIYGMEGETGLNKAIPLAKFSPEAKDNLPSEIVFARGANELVDYNITLSLSSAGKPEQRITTVSGKPLELTIRPDQPVKSVKGYLVFKSRRTQVEAIQIHLASLFNSLIFAEPAFAQMQEDNVEIEEKLVLMEFDYYDSDNDGLYTANIVSPVPEGEYEIITVINYIDPELGTRQIRLITVVDPEGYIYEKVKGQELRVKGAITTLYWLNPVSNKYEMWPAKEYQQENNQVTSASGAYSFLVPSGSYYIAVSAPGYISYQSKVFQVEEGRGVHMNVELKSENWWLEVLDWRTLLLVVVIFLLSFNFYKDKQRESKNNK